MARQSRMLPLGTAAPPFALPDTLSGKTVALKDIAPSPALLVAFICNHCPYVKHILDGLVAFGRELGPQGVSIVAISSNDAESHPADGPVEMARIAKLKGFTFSYLYDESQDVAKAYQAVCTPDFFLFDRGRQLIYRGQFDDSRPGNTHPVTGADLRSALNGLLEGRPVMVDQKPSIGCNIKWRAANAAR